MSKIEIPKQYIDGIHAIVSMDDARFALLLNAVRDLPLEWHQHMVMSSLKNRLEPLLKLLTEEHGDEIGAKVTLQSIAESIISLATLKKHHAGHGGSVGMSMAEALGEYARENTKERFSCISDALVAPYARIYALDSLGNDTEVDCIARSNISIVPKIEHAGKPVAFHTFTVYLTHGDSEKPDTLTLDLSLDGFKKIKDALALAEYHMEQEEKGLSDTFSFIRQEKYGQVR